MNTWRKNKWNTNRYECAGCILCIVPRWLSMLLSGYDSDRVRRVACYAIKCYHRMPIVHYAINRVASTNAMIRINLQCEAQKKRSFLNTNEQRGNTEKKRTPRTKTTNADSAQLQYFHNKIFVYNLRAQQINNIPIHYDCCRQYYKNIPELRWLMRLSASERSVKFVQYWNGSLEMYSMLLLLRLIAINIGVSTCDDMLHKTL